MSELEISKQTTHVPLSEHIDLKDNPLLSQSHDETTTNEDVATWNDTTESKTMGSNFYDVRVAVVGNVDAGKSSLIGVLTGGQLDNGRGLARSRVFLHKHENETGRTSAISQQIMGFTAENQPVHNPTPASSSAALKTRGWSNVVSGSSHLMTFIDLAGHEKYLKTTIAGLTGCFPDYAMVIINSLAGVTKMTKEHIGVVLALGIPLIFVVTKVDLAPQNVLVQTKTQLFKILKSSAVNKLPLQIKNSNDIKTVISAEGGRVCPVFFISCVSGVHISLLNEYLALLKPRRSEWLSHMAHAYPDTGSDSTPTSSNVPNSSSTTTNRAMACEYVIDETFLVTGVGVVVSGTVSRGRLDANSTLLLGPQSDGTFKPVFVRTLHCKRMSVDHVDAGDNCAVSIRAVGRKEHLTRQSIRRGMCLVDPSLNPVASLIFEAEVHILHHPTTIRLGYQAVIHSGMIRQVACLVEMRKIKGNESSSKPDEKMECLRTGDRALCKFRFLIRPELIHAGALFIFREGSTKGIGKVVRTQLTEVDHPETTRETETKNN
jgi:small GTP-binding protein